MLWSAGSCPLSKRGVQAVAANCTSESQGPLSVHGGIIGTSPPHFPAYSLVHSSQERWSDLKIG